MLIRFFSPKFKIEIMVFRVLKNIAKNYFLLLAVLVEENKIKLSETEKNYLTFSVRKDLNMIITMCKETQKISSMLKFFKISLSVPQGDTFRNKCVLLEAGKAP